MVRQSRGGETVAALFLFAAAALLMCGVVAFGAESYAAIRAQAQSDAETAAQYVATKVRSADGAGGIEARPDRLLLHEWVGGDEYITELYILDGSLRELYRAADVELPDEAGLEVIPADGLRVDVSEGVLDITVTAAGESSSATCSPRCGFVQGDSRRGDAK